MEADASPSRGATTRKERISGRRLSPGGAAGRIGPRVRGAGRGGGKEEEEEEEEAGRRLRVHATPPTGGHQGA